MKKFAMMFREPKSYALALSRASVACLISIGLAACSAASFLSEPPGRGGVDAPSPNGSDLLHINSRVALGSLSGPSQTVAKSIAQHLDAAAQQANIALMVDPGVQEDLRLQGYFVAARTNGGVNVSYVWDVFDGTGARVARNSGHEFVAGASDSSDIWSAIPTSSLKIISQQGVVALVSAPRPALVASETRLRQ